ncbi:anti-sigma B factor antagonist [Actinoalloteichus hoggarensis]|uniref:Anti-sigma factor antagonist n=1 Tax=Actinoalloteichus hoggarensis TaxID=1470176 RepID=A0A221W251_9PSEU|nr:STAS domain-containing protein [Actinoalloteichus hoggarensis]ASO19856.1 Anti-sigma-B factor antagonist [Actinoalloteichus hoggarensis]MBB5919435.1 anti-sigma B factor antagonist [Actinoalloteichus hoggarensis]
MNSFENRSFPVVDRHSAPAAGRTPPVDSGRYDRDRAERALALSVEHSPDSATVITLVGEVDMLTAPLLDQALGEQLEDGGDPLVVDLREVDFLGVTGLAVLADGLTTARATGVALRLLCAGRPVRRALAATGMDDPTTVYHTLTDALTVPVPRGAS